MELQEFHCDTDTISDMLQGQADTDDSVFDEETLYEINMETDAYIQGNLAALLPECPQSKPSVAIMRDARCIV